jgi:hypothetical protein
MDQLMTGLHQTSYLNAALKKLLLRKESLTRKDVFDLSSELVNHGVLTPQRAAAELASLPSNEDQIRPWAFVHWLTTKNHIEQLLKMIQAKGAMRRLAAVTQQPSAASGQVQAQFQGESPTSAMSGPMPAGAIAEPPTNRLLSNGAG